MKITILAGGLSTEETAFAIVLGSQAAKRGKRVIAEEGAYTYTAIPNGGDARVLVSAGGVTLAHTWPFGDRLLYRGGALRPSQGYLLPAHGWPHPFVGYGNSLSGSRAFGLSEQAVFKGGFPVFRMPSNPGNVGAGSYRAVLGASLCGADRFTVVCARYRSDAATPADVTAITIDHYLRDEAGLWQLLATKDVALRIPASQFAAEMSTHGQSVKVGWNSFVHPFAPLEGRDWRGTWDHWNEGGHVTDPNYFKTTWPASLLPVLSFNAGGTRATGLIGLCSFFGAVSPRWKETVNYVVAVSIDVQEGGAVVLGATFETDSRYSAAAVETGGFPCLEIVNGRGFDYGLAWDMRPGFHLDMPDRWLAASVYPTDFFGLTQVGNPGPDDQVVTCLDLTTGRLVALANFSLYASASTKRLHFQPAGQSNLTIPTASVALATGYLGDRRVRLMQELTVACSRSGLRSMEEDLPAPPYARYQAEISGNLSIAMRWYWEIDGVARPESLGFRCDSSHRAQNVGEVCASDRALVKTAYWIDMSADCFVRPILADPTLGLAAFELYEPQTPSSGRRATFARGPHYGYRFAILDADAGQTNWIAVEEHTTYQAAWDAWGGGEPPAGSSVMTPLGVAQSLPAQDYSRYLLLLTERGLTKHLVSTGHAFQEEWVGMMPPYQAPQPEIHAKSYTAQLAPLPITSLLPRYGDKVAFVVNGEYLYIGPAAPDPGEGDPACIVSRASLAERLPEAVPGYPA
jgi:hypothetical protein